MFAYDWRPQRYFDLQPQNYVMDKISLAGEIRREFEDCKNSVGGKVSFPMTLSDR